MKRPRVIRLESVDPSCTLIHMMDYAVMEYHRQEDQIHPGQKRPVKVEFLHMKRIYLLQGIPETSYYFKVQELS